MEALIRFVPGATRVRRAHLRNGVRAFGTPLVVVHAHFVYTSQLVSVGPRYLDTQSLCGYGVEP